MLYCEPSLKHVSSFIWPQWLWESPASLSPAPFKYHPFCVQSIFRDPLKSGKYWSYELWLCDTLPHIITLYLLLLNVLLIAEPSPAHETFECFWQPCSCTICSMSSWLSTHSWLNELRLVKRSHSVLVDTEWAWHSLGCLLPRLLLSWVKTNVAV